MSIADHTSRTTRVARIFISYSRVDADLVDRLEATLGVRGFELLIDRRDIHHFEDWWDEIERLIGSCDIVAMIISPEAIASRYCSKEIEFAASLGKRLAPIRYRPVPEHGLPPVLARLQLFDFDIADFDTSCGRLVAALTVDIDWTLRHTDIAAAALRWTQKGHAHGLLLRSPALEEAEHWIATRPRESEEPTESIRTYIADSRRYVTRRQRNIVFMALTAAVAAIALSGFAFWQMRVAERNFAAAKTAADGLVYDFVKSLRYQKGMSQDLVRTLLHTSEVVLDRIAPATGTSEELLLTRFELLIEFEQTYWYIGDIARARDYGARALAAAKQLMTRADSLRKKSDARSKIYQALMQTGDTLRNSGDLETSRAYFEQSRDLLEEELGNGMAGDRACLQPNCLLLARTYARIGDVLRTEGQFARAAAQYEATRTLLDRYLAVHHDDVEWLSDRAQLHNRFGDNELQVAQHEGFTLLLPMKDGGSPATLAVAAARSYHLGLDLRRRLLSRQDSDVRRQRDVIWSLALAGMASIPNDGERAMALLDEGLREVEAGLAADHDNTELLRYQALLYAFHGDAQLSGGDTAAAFEDYGKGLSIRKRLAEEIDKANARWLRDLFYTYRRTYLISRSALPEAASGYQRAALQILPALALKYPADAILASAMKEVGQSVGAAQ